MYNAWDRQLNKGLMPKTLHTFTSRKKIIIGKGNKPNYNPPCFTDVERNMKLKNMKQLFFILFLIYQLIITFVKFNFFDSSSENLVIFGAQEATVVEEIDLISCGGFQATLVALQTGQVEDLVGDPSDKVTRIDTVLATRAFHTKCSENDTQ